MSGGGECWGVSWLLSSRGGPDRSITTKTSMAQQFAFVGRPGRCFALAAAFVWMGLLGSSLSAGAVDCSSAAAQGINWGGCDRSNLVISGADLQKADLRRTDLSLTDLRQANLTSANLEKATLVRALLGGASADKADFGRVEGYRTDFSRVLATGASFKSAELQRADFTDAVLTGADFEKAELGRAVFKGADLQDNSFSYANLARAEFQGADIGSGLDFTGAYMFLTHLDGVDLSTVKGLQQPQVDLACGDTKTKLPAGLTAPTSWPCGAYD